MLLDAVCQKHGIKQLYSAPYNPQCNGTVERVNKTIVDGLARMSVARNTDWDLLIEEFAYSYNATVHSATKCSPFHLVFGRKVFLDENTRSKTFCFTCF